MKRFKSLAPFGLLIAALTGCGQPEALTPRQIAEQNKPGTVMIQTVHKAQFSVPNYDISQPKLDALAASLRQLVEKGEITSEEQAFAEVVWAILKDPLHYFEPLNEYLEESAEISTTGSALAITEDGHLITNAHVVSSEQDDLKLALAEQTLAGIATASCQEIWSDFSSGYYQDAIRSIIGTAEFEQLCLQAHAKYYAYHMNLDAIDTEIYAALGSVTALDEIVENGYKATVKAAGEPAPGKDVAILKIEADNMPTVALGNDEDLAAGDRMFILGYPGAGILNGEDTAEASLTAGLVSARKAMPDDWDILQTDAAMNSGNSGGPVFNEAGEAIGIATFGKVDPESGAKVEGVNFVIPMAVVSEFLAEANVEPAVSNISQLYQQGIAQFEAEKYQRALKTFRQVSELNPDYPYVQSYLSKVQQQIGQDESLPVPLWAIAAGTLFALGGIGGTYVFLRRGHLKLPMVKTN